MTTITDQEIKLRGVPCVIEIKNDGITIRRKGTRKMLDISWEKIGKVAQLPDKAPAKCLADPLGYVCPDVDTRFPQQKQNTMAEKRRFRYR